MGTPLKIGNASGFWGDRPDAARILMEQAPDLDFLTFDYLAEVSLSVMASQRSRSPEMGFARDFVDAVASLAPFWKSGSKTKIVSNAGGLNPRGCAKACAQVLRAAGCGHLKIGVVTGDDVMPLIEISPEDATFNHFETGEPITAIMDRLYTANAYIGAAGPVEALRQGADIVITGRMADPIMGLVPPMYHYGWDPEDYDLVASGTVAGHMIECGSQCCGGVSTNWLDLPNLTDMAFPIIEMDEDGTFVVTKAEAAGGAVNEQTVKEQILYEIGDPGNYLTPDCVVSFLTLNVEEIAANRVRVSNVEGNAPPDTLKVSATYRDGFMASSQLTIFGDNAVAKAQKSGEIILERLEKAGYTYARTNIECLGAGACVPGVFDTPELKETVLRLSVADPDREAVTRFAKELSTLACGGAQGTTGYAGGRARPSAVFGFWPCLVDRKRVHIKTELLGV